MISKLKVQSFLLGGPAWGWAKFKVIIPLLLLLIAFGCQKVEKPIKNGTGPLAITIEVDEAPESHTADIETPYAKIPILGEMFKSRLKGLDYWKVNHPNLVTGTHNPALLTDTDETCLDCHDRNTSCNNCHSYVGVKMISGDME